MLLIPFIENAFKHGSLINGFLQVEIEIALAENQMKFSIRNSFINSNTDDPNSGIGLENIKKRLELHYSNNHHLEIENKDNWFYVNLTILNINAIKNA